MQTIMTNTPRKPAQPTRTCVGCRAEDRPAELVRLVLAPEGGVVVDLAGGAFGRGAWVHPRPECLKAAAPRGLSRSFRAPVRTQARELVLALRQAADRRAAGLLMAARRGGKVACGTTVVREALEDGSAQLVIVATDAAASAQTPWIEQAVVQGRAAGWGTKARLGELTGRPDTGVVAVLDAGLATALSRTIAMIQMPLPASGRHSEDG